MPALLLGTLRGAGFAFLVRRVGIRQLSWSMSGTVTPDLVAVVVTGLAVAIAILLPVIKILRLNVATTLRSIQ